MDFSQNEVSPLRRYGGFGLVILLHVLVAYALITGLATKMVDAIKEPVETKIVEEAKPPPPPDTPPPPPPPHMAAPPPPFIPPPEVQIQQPQQQNVIQAVTNQQPPAQVFTKTPEVPTKAPPAAAPPVPGFADLNACAPDYPPASLRAEESGTSRVQFEVGADGQLIGASIVKSSGFKNLDRAAVNGLSRCKFRPAVKDGVKVQSSFVADYVWKLPD